MENDCQFFQAKRNQMSHFKAKRSVTHCNKIVGVDSEQQTSSEAPTNYCESLKYSQGGDTIQLIP